MSLLNQASSWSSATESKKNPKMKNSYNKIQNEIKDDVSDNILESFEAQKKRNTKVQELLNKMNEVDKNNDENNLADFSPLMPLSSDNKHNIDNNNDEDNENEGFSTMNLDPTYSSYDDGSPYVESYRPTPYYQKFSQKNDNNNRGMVLNNEFIEKINYMIQLLEEQQKEPTNNIIEEFALYSLLGVFMIYLVDSFTRVGKYVR
jgi:hypothetical protein